MLIGKNMQTNILLWKVGFLASRKSVEYKLSILNENGKYLGT